MEDNQTIEIDLKELFYALLDKIVIIILCTILFAGAAFVYTKVFIPKTYTASLSMFVKNYHKYDTEDNGQIELSDINASQELVNAYIEILTDESVIDLLAEHMDEKYGENYMENIFGINPVSGEINTPAVKECIKLSSKNETEVLSVTATTTDPELSANMCNSMADIAPDVLKRVVGAGSVERIGDAKVPTAPSAPSVSKNTALGGMGGLVLSCGIVILCKLLNNTAENVEKTAVRLNLAPLGEIPVYKGTKGKSAKDARLTLLDTTDFLTTEAYKSMLSNLIFTLGATRSKSFIITSAFSGEGKSITAANLAITLARNNTKVLLIDGDMRKPTQHKMFNIQNSKGLSTVLSGISTIEESIFKIENENFYLMPSGEIPPNPQALLSSKNMEDMLAKLNDEYDYIIFDMSPAGIVSDCMALAKLIPNVVLVAKYGKTRINALKKLIVSLNFVDINILGLAVNKVETEKKPYKNYYYSENYSS